MKIVNTILVFGITIACLTQQAAAAAEKNFVWYCESDEATSAQKTTVREIYYESNLDPDKVSCKEAFSTLLDRFGLSFYFSTVILTDLSPLAGLVNTRELYCEGCNQKAVISIPYLPNLVALDLKAGGLTTFPDLTKFENLRSLRLSYVDISEVAMSSNLKKIKKLELNETKIADFSFLVELDQLEKLALATPIKDSLRTLPELPHLSQLSASYLTTHDYSFLKKAKNVSVLALYENGIKDLSSIFLADSVKSLDLYGNKIEYIPPDVLPKGLEHITLGANPLAIFDSLEKLEKLDSLNLGYSNFSDWRSIEKLLGKLKILNVYQTNITEIDIESSPVKNWPMLEKLYIDETQIESLTFFKNISAPKLNRVAFPYIENKTEENCPTSGVPEVVAEFCKQ